tara:strand:+ start:309 stop:602 length:294 start_codon:yes stop_codon:yes gene_type:complete
MSRKSTTTLPPEIPGIAGLNQDDKNIVMSFPPISQSIKNNIKSLKILNRKMKGVEAEKEAAAGLVQLSKKQKNTGGKTRNKRRGKRSNKTRRRKSCK